MSDARDSWSAAAASWRNAPASGELITQTMVEFARPEAGERILELACGTGVAGIAAATAAGGSVELVLSDFAPAMVAAAVEDAQAAGIASVTGRELDLEAIDESDGTYDLALCRMGIMLVGRPPVAASEIARVLRPEGRAVFAVWGPRERNPWLRIVFEVLGELWGIELPPSSGPHPFALDSAAALTGLLLEHGFVDIQVEEVLAPYEAASATEWWDAVAGGGGPLGQLVGCLPEDQRLNVRGRAIERIEPQLEAGVIQRTALVALGRSPA